MDFHEFVRNKDVEFCEERKKGAAKIAREATAKGGYARLTGWHFSAKLPEYTQCVDDIGNKSKDYYKQKMVSFLRAAMSSTHQKQFQELMGKAEVWGEVYFELKH